MEYSADVCVMMESLKNALDLNTYLLTYLLTYLPSRLPTKTL
jgi:hypothetical protein